MIRALRDRRARVFVSLGGNFVRATPDSAATEAALENADLTVQISTKLNRSHTVTGRTALILPTQQKEPFWFPYSSGKLVFALSAMRAAGARGMRRLGVLDVINTVGGKGK